MIDTFIYDRTTRKKIILTIGLIFLFRVLTFIPVPFINQDSLSVMSQVGIIGYINMFTGGAFANFSFMATGISAYISASIIIQLLTYAIPALHDVQSAPGGDKIIKRYTIILGIFAAFFLSLGATLTLNSKYSILTEGAWYVYILIAIIHSIGTGIAVWIGETITLKGFGNGVSLLIFVNITTNLPRLIGTLATSTIEGITSWYITLIAVVVSILVVISIVIANLSERRIPLQYSKATARGETMFKTKSFLPIKLNLSGVMPIIFATTIMQIIATIGEYSEGPVGNFIKEYLYYGKIPYFFLTALLIFGFTYLYTALIFNPKEISNVLQSNGAIIPGIKPGKETTEYIAKVNKSMKFYGAFYLAMISLLPSLIFSLFALNGIATTSMMILVGVALETTQKIQIEIQAKTAKEL